MARQQALSEGLDWRFIERVFVAQGARTIFISGPPGIGKTHAAFNLGCTDAGVFSITLTEDTPAAELRGHYVPKGGELVWRDGPFTSAMRTGARLVVNEISHGSPEALTMLYPVLEEWTTAQLTLPTNETVRPAAGFTVVATDNRPITELPPALMDRFDCILHIDEPHPDALERLRPTLRRAALKSLALEEQRRVSLRSWLALERLLSEGFDLKDACRAVFGAERGAQIHDAIVLAESEDSDRK